MTNVMYKSVQILERLLSWSWSIAVSFFRVIIGWFEEKNTADQTQKAD